MEQIKGKPEYVQMEGEYPPLIQQESLATQSIESAKQLGNDYARLKFDSFKADSSQVYLSWSNVNFSVPLKKEDKALVEQNKITEQQPKVDLKKLSPLDL